MASIDTAKLEKMSVAERAAVEQQVKDQEEQLANPEKLAVSGQRGTSEMKVDIAKKKELLAKDEELIAKGNEKDSIVAELKQLEAIFLKDMPTKNEMWPKSGTVEADRAVQKNMRFHKLHGKLVLRWQILKKRLEPDDPWAQSLESIRPN